MAELDTTVAQTTETTDENENSTNDESQTVDGADGSSTEGSGDEKSSADSYYEEQLKALQAERDAEKKRYEDALAEKKHQLEIKDRALAAEKKKAKSVPADEDVETRVYQRIKTEQLLEQMVTNDAERKLVLHHLENSVVRSGDVKTDLERARAVANASRITELLGQQAQDDAREDAGVASMSAGNISPSRGNSKMHSEAYRQAAEILKGINPEAVKHLDKYLR